MDCQHAGVLLDDRLFGKLETRVFEILEKIGIRVDHDAVLEHLRLKGFPVDTGSRVVRFRRKDVVDVIEYQKKQALGREEGQAGKYYAQIAATVAPFYYDYEKKERRYPTRTDLAEFAKFADARGDCVSAPVSAIDVEPEVEPIASLVTLVTYAHRPSAPYAPYAKSTAWISTFATAASQVDYMARINKLVYGEAIPPRGPDFMTSPLTMGPLIADYLLAVRKYNVPFYCIGTQPISGMTAPLSVVGAVATGASEILAGWIVIKSLVDSPVLTGAIGSGITDTRKAVVCFNAPEVILQNAAVVKLFEKMCGGHVDVAAGNDYIDAKLPGFEALFERAYRALATSALCGRELYTGGSGLLDQGRIFSPVQFLLDEEAGEGFWRLTKEIPMDEESIDLEAFREVAFRDRSFIDTEHAARNCRNAYWLPRFFDRSTWTELEHELGREEQMLKKAHEQFKKVLSGYEPPAHDAAMLEEVQKIYVEARAALLGE